MLYYYPEDVYKVERILSDINVTKNKTDEAWYFYRNGKYEEAYEFILQINADISDIKERIDRIKILRPGEGAQMTWSLILMIIALIIIISAGAYYYTKKKRLR